MGSIVDQINSTSLLHIGYGPNEQPYVTVDINTQEVKLLNNNLSLPVDPLSQIPGLNGADFLSNFLLRVYRAGIDVSRIASFLADPTIGPQFLLTQASLQLMNIQPNLGTSGTGAQIYDPTSPIVQTGLQGIGGHVRRTLSSPIISAIIGYDTDTYEKIYKQNRSVEEEASNEDPYSAIFSLFKNTYDTGGTLSGDTLYSYTGGPGALSGLGITSIKRYYNTPLEQSLKPELAQQFISEAPQQSDGVINPKVPFNIIQKTQGSGSIVTWLDNQGPISYSNYYGDVVTITTTKKWKDINREVRIGSGRQDTINLTPIFNSTSNNQNTININNKNFTIEDLIKFRIEAIDTDNPLSDLGCKKMVFRAYLTSFSDGNSSDWSSTRYTGRGDNVWNYSGFNRTVSISWKVAALSEAEMIPMYQKLNFLMSNMAPDYKNQIMRGPFMRMTVGNWFYRQPSIINSLTYSVSNDSPWEIALSESDINIPINGKRIMYELPHIVEVNMSFTPIGIGPQALIPSKGESNPFILYKPKENTDEITGKYDNLWLTQYYDNGKTDPLTSYTGK